MSKKLLIKVNGIEVDTVNTTRELKAAVIAPVIGNEDVIASYPETNTLMQHALETGYVKLRLSLSKELAEKAIKSIEKDYGWKNCFVTTELEEATRKPRAKKLVNGWVPIQLIP